LTSACWAHCSAYGSTLGSLPSSNGSRKSLADNDHNMRRMTGDALTRAQGESLCIEHMLEVIGNADKLLKR